MSYIYPPDRNDYFESTYLPQIGASTQYDFYQAPSEPGEPLIPYGWRSDWNRPNGGARLDWTTMSSPGVVHSLPTLSTGAFTSNGSTLPGLHAHTTLHSLPTTSTATMGLHMNGTPLNTVHLTGLHSSLPPSLPSTNSHSLQSVTGLNPHISYGASVTKPLSSVPRSILKVSRKEATKPFPCHICGKSFSQAANLTAHKRVHTGEKPFSCSVCQRPFSQSSSLVTHKRTHTGERPYPCPHCDKAFTDSSTLTKHLRTHTGLKPYSCPMCLMRFTQSGNLHRHMKTHRSSK